MKTRRVLEDPVETLLAAAVESVSQLAQGKGGHVFWVYMLRCADDSFYVGHTDSLEQRIGQHQSGAVPTFYTYKRRPLKLVFQQEFPSRVEALAAERQIKGWSRAKKVALIAQDWAEVSRLAKGRNIGQRGAADDSL